ncbi:hypothetical protein F4860DRAFT_120315 [Xylaria cubensis]|nr:hypothetical protein F4860DRAFT_120315 [Xylaria cubensis]
MFYNENLSFGISNFLITAISVARFIVFLVYDMFLLSLANRLITLSAGFFLICPLFVVGDELMVSAMRLFPPNDPLEGRRIWFYPFYNLALSAVAVASSMLVATKEDESNVLTVCSIVLLALSVLDVAISLGARSAFPNDERGEDIDEIMNPVVILRTIDLDHEAAENTSLVALWRAQHTAIEEAAREQTFLPAIDSGMDLSSAESSSSSQPAPVNAMETSGDASETSPLLNDLPSNPGSPAVLHPSILTQYESSRVDLWILKPSILILTFFSSVELVTIMFQIRAWLHAEPEIGPTSRIIRSVIVLISPALLTLLLWIPLALLSAWRRRSSIGFFFGSFSYHDALSVCGVLLLLLRMGIIPAYMPKKLWTHILSIASAVVSICVMAIWLFFYNIAHAHRVI